MPISIPLGEGADFKGTINLIENKAYIIDGGKETAADIPAEMNDIVENYRTIMVEAAAEGDDEILEKYFEVGTLTADEIRKGLIEGIKANKIVPVFFRRCNNGSRNYQSSKLYCKCSSISKRTSGIYC